MSVYGAAEYRVTMPQDDTGQLGLATLYAGILKFNVSGAAWDGSNAVLVGGTLPVPETGASNLLGGDGDLQPRPGTMPGLYLLQVDTTFFHYGGPVESGADPQTTAVYSTPEELPFPGEFLTPPPPTLIYTNNLSGAQLWYYQAPSTPYVEIKHVDGTIARFDSFQPWTSTYVAGAGANKKMWRLTEVKDPYDNAATYSWDSNNRLTSILFPSGLKQEFGYSLWSGWSNPYHCLAVTYKQGSTSLSARTWGLTFNGTLGSSGGTHFGARLHRVYSTSRDVLLDATGAYSISSSTVVSAQPVNEITYATGSTYNCVQDYQSIHTGTPFSYSLSSPSGTGTAQVFELAFAASGTDSGRIVAETLSQLGETYAFSYPTSGFRTTDLLGTPTVHLPELIAVAET